MDINDNGAYGDARIPNYFLDNTPTAPAYPGKNPRGNIMTML